MGRTWGLRWPGSELCSVCGTLICEVEPTPPESVRRPLWRLPGKLYKLYKLCNCLCQAWSMAV